MTAYADIADRGVRLAVADLVEVVAKAPVRRGKAAEKG